MIAAEEIPSVLNWPEIPPLEEATYTVVSTFAGCGGSSLGYRMEGGKVVLAVEWDDNAAETYALNHSATRLYHGDIKDLEAEQALELSGLDPGELDVFDGSPPCQGFSTAGKRVFHDSRNNLFLDYVRLLEAFRPKVFIMENVSGMVKGKMKLIFVEILKTLKAAGYRVSARLLNAMYFGVPQSRQRIIFVGVRDDLIDRRTDEPLMPSHPKPLMRPITVKEALPHARRVVYDTRGIYASQDVTEEPMPAITAGGKGSSNRHHYQIEAASEPESNPSSPLPPPLDDAYGRLYSRIPQGGNASHVVGKGQNSCVKPHPNKPAPTLPATQTGHGFATIAHPTERRALTIEEAKILQSFPPDFEFIGGYSRQWHRIGNSVPPLMMRAIAEHVRVEILENIR